MSIMVLDKIKRQLKDLTDDELAQLTQLIEDEVGKRGCSSCEACQG